MMGFAERLFVRRDYFSGPAKVVFFRSSTLRTGMLAPLGPQAASYEVAVLTVERIIIFREQPAI